MKCKTCPLKVNAKSKFGIYYVFLVETGACKVVCEGPWTCAVRYLFGPTKKADNSPTTPTTSPERRQLAANKF